MSYAIRKAASAVAGTQAWEALLHVMLSGATADASCLRHVAGVLEMGSSKGTPPDLARLADTMNDLCVYHAPREHGSEIAWALWIMNRFGVSIDEQAAASVADMQDNCSLILLFDLLDQGLIDGATPDMTAIVARAEDANAWLSEDWLLAYECARNGWASDAGVRAQRHWEEILVSGVFFFQRKPATGLTPATSVLGTLGWGKTSTPVEPAVPEDEEEEEEEEEGEDEEEDGGWLELLGMSLGDY